MAGATNTNKYGFFKKSGVTANTPKRINLGAGTIYKNLKFSNGAWAGSIFGATSGGNKYSITNNIKDLSEDIDGVHVKTKGLQIKQGDVATLDVNMVEITKETIKLAILGKEDTTNTVDGFNVIKTKEQITDEDYLDNIAFVGFTTEHKPIIVIMDNAICTSGFDTDNKDKDTTVITLKFECCATLDAENHDVLPVTIYMPTEA